MIDNPNYEATRQRHLAEALEQLPGYLEQLQWPQERLRQERQKRLGRLLEWARERSPWHRQRLAHLDLTHVDEGQLSLIPPMTKDELMLHFDQIVTDPQLSLSRVEALIAGSSQAGLQQPAVLVRTQASFERDATDKFKRFIPLYGTGDPAPRERTE